MEVDFSLTEVHPELPVSHQYFKIFVTELGHFSTFFVSELGQLD